MRADARDEADEAQEQEERFREEALRRTREGSKRVLGHCHNCGDSCQGEFCDKHCREDFERRERVQRKTRTSE